MAQSNTKIDPRMVKWDEEKPASIDPKMVKWDEPEKPKRTSGSGAVDAANAVGTGYWRGATRLLGMPVDTVQNVIDLAKAGIGTGYSAVTGKAPPSALDPADRRNVVGSGEWLLNKARGTEAGRVMVDPVNPEYEGGYLQNAGAAVNSIMGPQTMPQLAQQAALGQASALLGKGTYDLTGSPELAIAAGMLPAGAQYYGTETVKRAVRGGEKGRREMAQRVQDLKGAGIERPTLGLASGNKQIGGVENVLQSTPGAIGVMEKSRDAALRALQNKTAGAAEAASPIRGALPAGQAIQSGIGGFKDQFKTRQTSLYDQLDDFVAADRPTNVDSTRIALQRLNADIPGAPNLSKLFKNSRIMGIEDALRADVSAPRSYTPSQLKAALERSPQTSKDLSAALGEGALPYQAVKQTRTLVGNEIADNSLMSDVPRSKWNPLYGALSDDMRTVADQAGPQATRAFNRANDYTRAGIDRLEKLRPFADKAAPEQAFTSLFNTTKENASVLQAVKKSIPESARGTVASTVIDRLGKATPGQQNDMGDAWSPERFLTNWNSMTPKARSELFSGFKNAAKVKAEVESVAKAASMMRDSSKMWANPSGTAAATTARAIFMGAPLTYGISPWAPVAVGGLLGANNLTARALTSPRVVNSMASQTRLSPEALQAQINSLVAPGLLDRLDQQ